LKLETGNWKLETGNWKLETGNWKLETGNWKLETGRNIPSLRASLLELLRNKNKNITIVLNSHSMK